MEALLYQVPYLGNGMTIGLIAVIHVIISHGLAIGVMSFIVLAEYIGIRRGAPVWDEFAKALLKPVTIIITGVGAVTGVGIWFSTSALAPRGIASLIRIFFWPWFVEWILFTVEVIVLLLYYFYWDSWSSLHKRRHLALGCTYLASAGGSAFLITGILGFMLTSDSWPWRSSLASAFFNTTFLPQLGLRLALAISIGALITLAYLRFSRRHEAVREEASLLISKVALWAFTLALLSAVIYFHAVPSAFKTSAVACMLTSRLSQHPEIFWIVNICAVSLLFAAALLTLKKRVRAAAICLPFSLIALAGLTAEFERIREFIRGPYLMPGYMYANQIMLSEHALFSERQFGNNPEWAASRPAGIDAQGAYLFGRNCSMCHTVGGLNDIRARLSGRPADAIFVLLGNTQRMMPFMPPFSGSVLERRLTAEFLERLAAGSVNLNGTSRYITDGR